MADLACSSTALSPTLNPANTSLKNVGSKLNSDMSGTENESPRTVLRIKRRIDEDPAQILLLSFKRCKGEGWKDGDDDDVKNPNLVQRVLKLAGTLTSDQTETSVAETISQALASKPKSGIGKPSLKARPIKILDKSRSKFQKSIVENRFRVISTKRGIDIQQGDPNVSTGEEDTSAAAQDLYNLYDLIKDDIADESVSQNIDKGNEEASVSGPIPIIGSITCNGLAMEMLSEAKKRTGDPESECKESESKKAREAKVVFHDPDLGYVYDLYITNEAIDNSIQNQHVSVQDAKDIFDEEVFVESESGDESEARMDDDDDSNEEDNWRYEYPSDDPDADEDEDEDDSGGEEMDVEGELDGLKATFNKMKFKEELSSDEDEDGSSRRYMKKTAEDSDDVEDEVVSSASDSD